MRGKSHADAEHHGDGETRRVHGQAPARPERGYGGSPQRGPADLRAIAPDPVNGVSLRPLVRWDGLGQQARLCRKIKSEPRTASCRQR
jgi:hypothetical protein